MLLNVNDDKTYLFIYLLITKIHPLIIILKIKDFLHPTKLPCIYILSEVRAGHPAPVAHLKKAHSW